MPELYFTHEPVPPFKPLPPFDQKFYEPEIQTMPRESIKELQGKRLRAQVENAWNTGFFKRKLKSANLTPEDIKTVDDLEKIPLLLKSELRKSEADHPPYGDYRTTTPDQWIRITGTSGTTGLPTLLIYSLEDFLVEIESGCRTLWRFGRPKPGKIFINQTIYSWIGGGWIGQATIERMGCIHVPWGPPIMPPDLNMQVQMVKRLRPTAMGGNAAMMRRIVQGAHEAGYKLSDIGFEYVLITGDPTYYIPKARKWFEDEFGCPVYSFGGTMDICGFLYGECEEKYGNHLQEDQVIMEFLDPETHEHVAPGESGVVVYTALTKKTSPLLRFNVEDIGSYIEEKCNCGETHMRCWVFGRDKDAVNVGGKIVMPVFVEKTLMEIPEVESKNYLIGKHGTKQDHLPVKIEYNKELVKDKEKLQEKVNKALENELGVPVKAQIVEEGQATKMVGWKITRIEEME